MITKDEKSGHLKFAPEDVVRLREAYEKAVKDEAKQFVFDGHDFVTGYAKYVLEFLEQ